MARLLGHWVCSVRFLFPTLVQATTDTPRLSKDLKEAQEVIDSLKEAFAASEQRADQQAQLFVQREQHWQNELAQAESLAEVAAQEKAELRKRLESVRCEHD